MKARNVEDVLQEIRAQRAIGAAKLGSAYLDVAARYGDPTDVIDVAGFGLERRCKIWNFSELQIWIDESGVIERVFLDVSTQPQTCANANLQSDLEPYRHYLKSCDFETFERVFASESAKIEQKSHWAQFKTTIGDTEFFATFLTNESDEIRYLAMLRINTVSETA